MSTGTRDEIIGLADMLIRRRGYNATSYADISGIMDVKPAAIHYYFHSKTDLGVAVILEELYRLYRFREFKAQRPGGEQLKQLFLTFKRSSLENQICLMGSLTPDFATFDQVMQDTVKELCEAIVDWVAFCLEDERTAGRMHFEGTAGDRALLVISTLMSSLLLARVFGQGVFVRMADQLLYDLGADWRVADLPLPTEQWPIPPHSFT